MLVPSLIAAVVILGAVVSYIYLIAPRRNPVFRAEQLISENRVSEAVTEYRKLLEKDPDNYLAHYKLANIYYKQNRIDQGVEHLEAIKRIGKYNYEVDRIDVERKLARAYLARDELDKGFQGYLNILRDHPADQEALYHAAFIALGQELFDMARKYFDRLTKQGKRSFEIDFGAGMAHYMNQNTNDAVAYFKEALNEDPHSEIGNLAMAFALQRKRDYKTAANYAQLLIDISSNEEAIFIARRLAGILNAQQGRWKEAYTLFEELKDFAQQRELHEELKVVLYDLGYVAIKAEKTEQAYEFWSQVYEMDKTYKAVKTLMTQLRKEMDLDQQQKREPTEFTVEEYYQEWIEEAFPEDFIWNICGLRSDQKIDMSTIIVPAKQGGGMRPGPGRGADTEEAEGDYLSTYESLDAETFRIVSNRMMEKLGYRVDEILPTYRESDGVDFMANNRQTGNRSLIWVRRWKGSKVGEIPLRNFAQAINDAKAKEGLFVTTTELTPSGENAVSRLSKVDVLKPEEVNHALDGLL
jgi:tetratricopeptide (TPR) repeat protein